jgi:FkbM family methyltransferase
MDHGVKMSVALQHAFGAAVRPLTNRITYVTRSGIAAGLKRNGGLGFLPRSTSDEERFYQSLDLCGKTVYDVGSYEGIFSLFAARAVGGGTLVVCEPNPECFRRTTRNLSLNQFECQFVLRNLALGETPGEVEMFCPKGEPARGTLNVEIATAIRNAGESGKTCRVRVERLDDLIDQGLPIPGFMKIDTEGSELGILKGAVKTLKVCRPELFIELHGTSRENWVSNRRAIRELLESLGYQIFDMNRQSVKDESRRVGHYYCKN